MSTFTKKEEQQLLAIPFGRQSVPVLKAWARANSRTYGSAYQKQRALHAAKDNSTISKKIANNVPAMTFTDVAFESKHTRVDEREEASMQKGLEDAIAGPLQDYKRAIVFPKRLMAKAKEYLVKKYPNNVFSFHAYKKDKAYMLLSKKL